MGKWKAIKATQEESLKSYEALYLLYEMLNGTISAKQTSGHLIATCGICSQVIVDDKGNERGIRILTDGIEDLSALGPFDFMLK